MYHENDCSPRMVTFMLLLGVKGHAGMGAHLKCRREGGKAHKRPP